MEMDVSEKIMHHIGSVISIFQLHPPASQIKNRDLAASRNCREHAEYHWMSVCVYLAVSNHGLQGRCSVCSNIEIGHRYRVIINI